GHLDKYIDNYRNLRTPRYTTDEKKEIYQRAYDMGKKGYFDQGLPAIDHVQSQMKVLQNEAALVFSGDWIAGEMKDKTPEDFEWGFMKPPMTNDPDIPLQISGNSGS